MNRAIFISLFSIILWNCKTTQEQTLMNDCEMVYNKFKDKSVWNYDTLKQHYIGHDSLLMRYFNFGKNKYTDCFSGKDTSFVSKTFGKFYKVSSKSSNNKYRYELVYELSKFPCSGIGPNNSCKKLFFYFNEKSKIEMVYYEVTSVDIHY